MVNRGASQGCITCKGRRVKCDETKPTCNQCLRVGRECAGYGKRPVRVRFKDQTGRYLKTTPESNTTFSNTRSVKSQKLTNTPCSRPWRSSGQCMIGTSPQPQQRDMAVAFFLTYVTDVGRNLESTRGYLEFVRPVLATESHTSALSAAVDATSLKLWSILRTSNVAASSVIRLHNQALIKLQDAVSSPSEQHNDATVFAALMLQQYDTLDAVFDRHKAHSTHRKGALALLTQNASVARNSKYYGHLLGNLFHSRISYCVRHKVPVTDSEVQWLHTEVIPTLPCNPSYLLDVIGISISKLQTAFAEMPSARTEIKYCALKELVHLIEDVDAQLQAWRETVPEFWQPKRIMGEHFTTQVMEMYDGFCDIYPSVQIANIWNTWRTYRLITEQVKLQLTQIVNDKNGGVLNIESIITDNLNTRVDLIESICRCIPFYLGNCGVPVSYSDIDNPLLTFPSYHDLPSVDVARVAYERSEYFVSKTDHNRHTALHGPLHALSILSSIIGLLFERQSIAFTQDVLQKQKQWIYDQFHRCLYLTRFASHDAKDGGKSDPIVAVTYDPKSTPTALAQATQQVLRTVSIL